MAAALGHHRDLIMSAQRDSVPVLGSKHSTKFESVEPTIPPWQSCKANETTCSVHSHDTRSHSPSDIFYFERRLLPFFLAGRKVHRGHPCLSTDSLSCRSTGCLWTDYSHNPQLFRQRHRPYFPRQPSLARSEKIGAPAKSGVSSSSQ